MNATPPAILLPSHILDHFTSFGTPAGRCRQRLRLQRARLAWRLAHSGRAAGKRLLDLFGSVAALVLLAPVFLLIIAAIRAEDGGPSVFAQTRVGLHGRHFKIYKFRSMRTDAEARLHEVMAANHHSHGITFKARNDPRVTRVGRWLRKLSLDELPQLVNVLIGDMSLVGPRPPIPSEVARYTLADRRRLAAQPGITCIWQISGRADIDFPRQVELDVHYIETQSLAQDLRILAKTLPAVAFGGGAY